MGLSCIPFLGCTLWAPRVNTFFEFFLPIFRRFFMDPPRFWLKRVRLTRATLILPEQRILVTSFLLLPQAGFYRGPQGERSDALGGTPPFYLEEAYKASCDPM